MALTIAGFDPSSGAGITADLQVFAAHGIFATACLTALTVQSTQGVAAVESVSHLIGQTLEHLQADMPAAGIKIGMLGDAAAVHAVAQHLRRFPQGVVVLDPVLVSSSGASLLDAQGVDALRLDLLPLITWLTPNLAELAILAGVPLSTAAEVEPALRALQARYPQLSIVATGGDQSSPVDTLLTPDGILSAFQGERVETTSTHGTGCAFSSALLSRLILGDPPTTAVATAKSYVTEALRRAPGLGKGRGPLNLLWPLTDPR